MIGKYCLSLLLVPLLSLTACNTHKKAASGEPGIRYEVLSSGAYSAIESPKDLLITDGNTWQQLWAEMNAHQIPAPARPEVDFSKNAVVACFMGVKNSGGYSVRIDRMAKEGNVLRVTRNYYAPGKNCISTMALTQPYVLVTIVQDEERNCVFEGEMIRKDCP